MHKKKLVLIVEDNEDLNDTCCRALKSAEYEVQTAFTLAEARERLESAEPSVILLDVNLPDGSGIAFCREIRNAISSRVILMPVTSDLSIGFACIAAGGDDYLSKPFDIELLLERVEKCLRRSISAGKDWSVNQNADVQSYFMERAHQSGPKAEVWNRVVDALLKNGVKTMRDFSEKEDDWLYRLFVRDENGKRVLDEEGRELSRDAHRKYRSSVHEAELLSSGEILLEAYFDKHAPKKKSVTNRVSFALRRSGISTMSALCAMSVEELKKVRNLGEKSLEIALMMREKYAAENMRGGKKTNTD